MRAYITGGSGFVGLNLIKMLVASEAEVYALARSSRAAEIVRTNGATPIPGDLFDPQALFTGMSGCDVVFHSAALMEFHGNRPEMEDVNIDGTRNVVSAAKAAGVPRLVFISAAAVISDGRPVINADESQPYPSRTFGAYCRTKAEAEKLVLAADAPGFTTVAVRPPLIWGSGDVHFLPEVIKAVTHRQFVWIDRGEYPYATCHVRNVCEGAILAAHHGRNGQAYFLTDGGPPVAFRQFLTDLLATQRLSPGRISLPRWLAWGMAAAMEKFPIPAALPVTRAHLALIGGEVTVNDMKARKELGYKGRISRQEGLAELARDSRAQRETG